MSPFIARNIRTLNVAILATVALSGCATLQNAADESAKTQTFAECATFDIATTGAFLAFTPYVELNPIVNAVHITALGHVLGTLVPAAGLAYLWYLALEEIDSPDLTAASTVASCSFGVHNLLLL